MASTTSTEALALLWAYELNRENKCLFKGLRKVNHRLSRRDNREKTRDIDTHPDIATSKESS
ncbi:uncharacterized protein N7506_010805 [Penicillium brevicompactum]|uniref:uncharacterized protein n=1 Tax=Penicillium brevicompactum TaxID=5074 RepID=UPI00253FD7CF|nr:uncharacterized protein N7506_010805 [Penicillium brevicompactum]KAJ5321675.1 hypothetical protein N7506_010805 [Penicillium brevicompactum]